VDCVDIYPEVWPICSAYFTQVCDVSNIPLLLLLLLLLLHILIKTLTGVNKQNAIFGKDISTEVTMHSESSL
jgi:hypothetical protein